MIALNSLMKLTTIARVTNLTSRSGPPQSGKPSERLTERRERLVLMLNT